MLKNYIKIAWRNIIKRPFYSIVNITGLATGIAFTLLIAAYVWNELQVNKNLKNADNQYILQSKWKDPNMGYEIATIGQLPKALREQYPNLVANYYRWDGVTSNVSKGEQHFREGLQIGDSTFLNMFGFSLLYGDARIALTEPYSVVITADKARKYFGTTDAIGQTLTIESFSGTRHDFKVTGLMKKPAINSITHITDDIDNGFYLPPSSATFFARNIEAGNIFGYVELQKGVSPSDLAKPIRHLLKQNTPAQVEQNLEPYLVPLKKYYLSANNGVVKKMLYTLTGIAFFIMLMAIINFINLSVSRSATRMREIGIRKVLGGLKKQLILQFLTESIVLVFFATIFAIAIFLLSSPLFSSMLGKEIPTLNKFPFHFIFFPLLLILFVGILAGVYPAFVLSSLKSVESLKGKLISIKENVVLRKSLVGFQFGIASIVLIGAILISQQIELFFSKNLGYNKDYVISAQLPRDWSAQGVRRMENIRRQFATMSQVSNVSLSFEVPDGNSAGSLLIYKAGSDSTTAITSPTLSTDEYYASTYSIPLAAGVFYGQPGSITDSSKIVINETLAKSLGWKDAQEAIGKQLQLQGYNGVFTVAGVTRDFHFGSMQQAIQPVAFTHVALSNIFRFLSFKLKPANVSNSISALQKQWSVSMPGASFEYTFMDDTLKKIYKSEIQLKQASYTATALSLIIVLLGVLGLISLSIQKRTKEIGIRKVLGSSVKSIVALFMKEFLLVILFAGIIACPVAYLVMKKWLSDYVYRIDITPAPFIVAISFLGILTAVLIIIQTIKTALANPMNSLRTE